MEWVNVQCTLQYLCPDSHPCNSVTASNNLCKPWGNTIHQLRPTPHKTLDFPLSQLKQNQITLPFFLFQNTLCCRQRQEKLFRVVFAPTDNRGFPKFSCNFFSIKEEQQGMTCNLKPVFGKVTTSGITAAMSCNTCIQ